MPELPEVETVCRGLSKCLVGRTIASVNVRHKPSVEGSPRKVTLATGRKVLAVQRRGKFIRVQLDGGMGFAIHLRMTGWLGVVASGAESKHDAYERLRMPLDGGKDVLVFRDIRTFGRVWFGSTEELDALPSLAKLGPEPLEIDAAAFAERLRARRGTLKSLILNQTFLAGVGNIYTDEALFASGLHPLSNAAKIKKDQAVKLHGAIQKILRAAIDSGGSSIDDFLHPDGQPGWFQNNHRVYGRHGEPCHHCKTPIERIVVGQRGTWFCAKCQKRR